MTTTQTAKPTGVGDHCRHTPPTPFLSPSLVFLKKPFDFSGVFLSRNKVNQFAGGAGLPSEVETWQNEDDRPASEGGGGGGRGVVVGEGRGGVSRGEGGGEK